MANFKPVFKIRVTPSKDLVVLEVSDPNDPEDFIPLIKDAVDVACYEVMEVYNAEEGDARFFRDWEHAKSYYGNEQWLGDDELGISLDDFEWDDEDDFL